MPEQKKIVIFLMALMGEPQTSIAHKFGILKSEVHDIVKAKLVENHIDETIHKFDQYTAWRSKVVKEELEKLWALL